ncbi:MAG: SRPBCC family protein [Planctomycetota bacterium]
MAESGARPANRESKQAAAVEAAAAAGFVVPSEVYGPPRCRDCGYVLLGVGGQGTAHECPECGRAFDPLRPNTVDWRPPFVFWRYWLPPTILSCAIAVLLTVLFVAGGSWGWALILGVPIMVGSVTGFGVRARYLVALAVAVVAVSAGVLGVFSLNFVGVLCGALFGLLLLVPTFVGVVCGVFLKQVLRQGSWPMRGYLPGMVPGLLAILIGHAVDQATPPPAIETVRTSVIIDAAPDDVDAELRYYESVEGPVPWWCRIGLPRPIGVEGAMVRVGDVQRCLYSNGGELAKGTTRREPGRELAFVVLQQTNVENNSIELVDGRFVLEPIGSGHTRLTLETRYRPKLQARAVWRPIEHNIASSLHRHVIAGVAEAIEGSGAAVAWVEVAPAPDAAEEAP